MQFLDAIGSAAAKAAKARKVAPPIGKLTVSQINPPGLPTSVSGTVFSPNPTTFFRDVPFGPGIGVSGEGEILYFQIDQPVTPRWFGVLVPKGVDLGKINLYFHPLVNQRGFQFDEKQYQSFANWGLIFHPLWEAFGIQFCAANTSRILVMPLMPNSIGMTGGVLPGQWHDIMSQILTQIFVIRSQRLMASGGPGGLLAKIGKEIELGSELASALASVDADDLVVTSFSVGILHSHTFRKRAHLGKKLKAVIDLDGVVSSFSSLSLALTGLGSKAVRVWQTPTTTKALPSADLHNLFPIGPERWGLAQGLSAKQKLLIVHRLAVSAMMFLAAKRAG